MTEEARKCVMCKKETKRKVLAAIMPVDEFGKGLISYRDLAGFWNSLVDSAGGFPLCKDMDCLYKFTEKVGGVIEEIREEEVKK